MCPTSRTITLHYYYRHLSDVVEVIAPDVEVNAADMNFCDIEDMTLEEVLEIADHKEALFLQRFSSPCLLQTPSSAKKHDVSGRVAPELNQFKSFNKNRDLNQFKLLNRNQFFIYVYIYF